MEKGKFRSNFRIRGHGGTFYFVLQLPPVTASCYNCYQLLPVATSRYQLLPVATSCYQLLPVATIATSHCQLLQLLPVATSRYQLLQVATSRYQLVQLLPVTTISISCYQSLRVATSRLQVDTSCCCCVSFSDCWMSLHANNCFVFINILLFQGGSTSLNPP